MKNITQKFTEVFKKGQCALMTHIIIGYPNLKTSEKLVIEMAQAGADFIEMQIPFSEPIADGPVFFEACQESIKRGTKVKDCFDLMARVSKKVDIPLLFMTYYNIPYHYGIENFCKDARAAGCCGFIIPDIPPEEAKEYLSCCNKYKLAPIFIVTPTSSIERIKAISKVAKGFIYCVGRTGITGGKTKFGAEFKRYLKRIQTFTRLPLGIGFGVKTLEDVKAISKLADMAIVGTAITQTFHEQGIEGVKNLIKTLKMQ